MSAQTLAEGVLVASAAELLEGIDAVCNDLEFDHGAGDCVKSDQAVPVTVGLPTLRAMSVRVITA
jgi:predicted Zn-dependent protease